MWQLALDRLADPEAAAPQPRAVASEGCANVTAVAADKAAKVFISYSRQDGAFVDRLDAELGARGIETFVDRHSIEKGEDWWQRIRSLILEADAIVFVISPDSVASDICEKEVAFADLLSKRLVPVVARDVEQDRVPAALRRRNYTILRDGAAWGRELDGLVRGLTTDFEWVRRHSEYGALGCRWSEAGHSAARLLRSPNLEEAEAWIASRPANAPMPSAETQAFILGSRRAATHRRRTLTASLAMGLIVALALAGLALWQRQVAVANEERANEQTALATEREADARRERDRAQAALADAKRAADGLIFDLAQGLRGRGLPVATIREVLARAETLMAQLVASAPDDPGLLRSQSSMYNEFADTYAAAGATDRQIQAAERSLAIARRLADREPSDPGAARDLWVSLNKVGDAQMARNDLAGALASFEESLAIARRLAARDPSDADSARTLLVSLSRVRDVQVARGDLAGAPASFEESLAIARRLAAEHPSDAGAARDLSLSLDRVGNMRMAGGDLSGALASYEESLEIRRRLATHDGTDTQAARDLSLSLNKIGDVKMARKDLEGAFASYEESLAIRRRLMGLDRSNADAARDVLVTASKLGGLAYQAVLGRDAALALKASDEAIEAAPKEIWLQTNRAHALMMLGRIEEARALYLRYRGQVTQDDKRWETDVADDFAEMRKAGIAHPLMLEIEAAFDHPQRPAPQ